jgi:hypothetical protein
MSRVPRDWVLAAGDAYEEASGRDDWFLTDIEAALAAVAPLIRRAALEEAAGMADAVAQEYQAEPDGNLVAETEGTTDIVLMVFNEVAAAIRALDT